MRYVITIHILQHFRQHLRMKDGMDEDDPETEIGEDFEILLEFVLNCRKLPAATVIEKYFQADSTLSLSNNALRNDLKAGSKDQEKLKVAEDDVKNVSLHYNFEVKQTYRKWQHNYIGGVVLSCNPKVGLE